MVVPEAPENPILDADQFHRRCPACGASLADRAVLCLSCGYNAATGQTVATAVKQEDEEQDLDPANQPPTLSEIYRTPFTTQFLSHVGVIAGVTLLASLGIGFIMIFALCLGWIIGMGLMIVLLAWLSRVYFDLVNAYERGGLASLHGSMWNSLAMLLWTMVVAWGPLVAALWVAGDMDLGDEATTALAWVAVAWAAVYWPMAVGQAGAYEVLNPLTVLRAIASMWREYALLLLYIIPLYLAVSSARELIPQWLKAEDNSLMPSLAAYTVSIAIGQFGACAQFAMLGQFLRRQRLELPLQSSEVAAALPWIIGAILLAATLAGALAAG